MLTFRTLGISVFLATSMVACGSSDSSPATGTGGSGGVGTSGTGGTTTIGGAVSTGGTLSISSSAVSCAACATSSCGPETAACVVIADCLAILTCASPCGMTDTTCIQSCVSKNPGGQTAFGTVSTCALTKCAGCAM